MSLSTRLTLALVAGGMLLSSPPASAAPVEQDRAAAVSQDAAARGMHYAGLVRNPGGPCGEEYELTTPGGTRCSHGPDAAPAERDVRVSYDVTSTSSGTQTSSTTVPCIGDGTSGPRVQVVYAVAADGTDRFATVAPSISAWAGQMDDAVNRSAAETGGERHIRFVTKSDCTLDIARVQLSNTGDDSFSNTIAELWAAGHKRTDRKYVMYVDANVYCGIAEVAGDDRPDASNPANSGPHYARVDSGCWGRTDHLSELHELMHTLGAIQPSAPHATDRAHCTDEADAMCYQDSAQVTMSYPCPFEHEWLLDCNHDDYFSTSPAPGSYLATHWNVANSVFLDGGASSSAPTAPSTTEPAQSTSQFSGTISNKKPTASYALNVGDGSASTTLEYTVSGKNRGVALTVRVLAADGTVVAESTGASPIQLSRPLSRGSYTWQVSGSTSASFTLTVTHATP